MPEPRRRNPPKPRKRRIVRSDWQQASIITELCVPRKKQRPRKKKSQQRKKYHRVFKVPLALGLIPTKDRQGDPLGLKINNTMHIMDGESEKTEECVGESAPELFSKNNKKEDSLSNINPGKAGVIETQTLPENIEKLDDEFEEEIEEEDTTKQNENKINVKEEEKDSLNNSEISTENINDEKSDSEKSVKEEENVPMDTTPSISSVPSPNQIKEEIPEKLECANLTNQDVNEESARSSPGCVSDGIMKSQSNLKFSEEDITNINSKHNIETKIEDNKNLISDRKREKDVEIEISSGSESENNSVKKLKLNGHDNLNSTPSFSFMETAQYLMDDDRERVIKEYVDKTCQSPDELSKNIDKLQKEIQTLTEFARTKELEWNSILRLRKLKEEMWERLFRKQREYMIVGGSQDELFNRNFYSHMNGQRNSVECQPTIGPSNNMIVGPGPRPPIQQRIPEIGRQHRPILPKPSNQNYEPSASFVVREGRNGPILDVRSIIADYRENMTPSGSSGSSSSRQRHPDIPPSRRGGRRPRNIDNSSSRIPPNSPSLINMSSMAFCSGGSIRTNSDPHFSMRTEQQLSLQQQSAMQRLSDTYSKMNHNAQPSTTSTRFPEVTLHPVVPSTSSNSINQQTSLLHGILTQQNAGISPTQPSLQNQPVPAHNRPNPFSPTLAKLLTAPDSNSSQAPQTRLPAPAHQATHYRTRVSINDILTSTKNSRTEITITPVTGSQAINKSKEEIVNIDDEDECAGDRLVIDESGVDESVPQCQGCKQKVSQFVCAGCGDQWYCSRECQVAAWEEHSDVCSG